MTRSYRYNRYYQLNDRQSERYYQLLITMTAVFIFIADHFPVVGNTNRKCNTVSSHHKYYLMGTVPHCTCEQHTVFDGLWPDICSSFTIFIFSHQMYTKTKGRDGWCTSWIYRSILFNTISRGFTMLLINLTNSIWQVATLDGFRLQIKYGGNSDYGYSDRQLYMDQKAYVAFLSCHFLSFHTWQHTGFCFF